MKRHRLDTCAEALRYLNEHPGYMPSTRVAYAMIINHATWTQVKQQLLDAGLIEIEQKGRRLFLRLRNIPAATEFLNCYDKMKEILDVRPH